MSRATVSIEARCRGLWRVRVFAWLSALLLGGLVPETRIDGGEWKPVHVTWHLDISVTDEPDDDDDDDEGLRVARVTEALHALEVAP